MYRYFCILILTICHYQISFAQYLTFDELLFLRSKELDQVNDFLIKKKWEINNAQEGDFFQYDHATWSFNRDNYDQKAQAWLSYLYSSGFSNIIRYQTTSNNHYNLIKARIKALGFKLIDKAIENNGLVFTFSDTKRTVTISTSKSEEGVSRFTFTIKKITKANPSTSVKENSLNLDPVINGNNDTFQKTELNIGDEHLGGIVFYILKDGDLGFDPMTAHGLIVAERENRVEMQWGNGLNFQTGAKATFIGSGEQNTELIIKEQGNGSYAAIYCYDYSYKEFEDWYLPSKEELNKLLTSKINLNLVSGNYWSSSEVDTWSVWYQTYPGCVQTKSTIKFAKYIVRTIRAF